MSDMRDSKNQTNAKILVYLLKQRDVVAEWAYAKIREQISKNYGNISFKLIVINELLIN